MGGRGARSGGGGSAGEVVIRKQPEPNKQGYSYYMTGTRNILSKTYTLSTGKSKIFDIWTTEGDNILKLRGNGVVTIDYRGGSL